MEDELTKVTQDSARSGFFLVSGTALSTVIMAVASILIARLLGPELYGQYALALVVPQLLFLFTDLGINHGITKFTAALQSKDEVNRIPNIIKHGILIRASIGITIFLINYALAGPIASNLLQRPELAFYIQLASISILFQVIFTTTTSAFVGLDKTEYLAITTNVLATSKTIISIVLVLIGLSITGAIVGYTVSYIVAAASSIFLLLLLLRKSAARAKKTVESDNFKTNLKTLFQYGTPLYISVLLTGFISLFQNVVLAFFTTDSDIGNFKAAINFAVLLTVIAGPITTVLLPAFSKLNSTTNQKIKDFFKIVNKYTTMIITPVMFLVIIFSTEIVQIVYGSTYNLASFFLSTYCLLYLIVGVGYLTLPSLYNGLGETKTTLKMSLITFVMFTSLAVPLTQTSGVTGIITAIIISHTVGTLYGAYKARKKHQVSFDIKSSFKIYLISAISSIAPLLLINFVHLNSILTLALGGTLYLLTYTTLMPLTNVVTSSELQKTALATQNISLLKYITRPILKYQQKIMQLKLNFQKTM